MPELGAERFRQPENEIEREGFNACRAEVLNRSRNRRRVVRAVHPAEHRGVERLSADRHPIHARFSPSAGRVGRHIVRVGFESNLDRATPPGFPGLGREFDLTLEQADQLCDGLRR